jgi:hypothetical protein
MAASSFRTVKAVWIYYKALHYRFNASSGDASRDEKEKAMNSGLIANIETHGGTH